MQETNPKAVSIQFKGRVQGVGFRYFVKHTADSCGVLGFVKNLPNGSVYVEVEGELSGLDLFIELCRQGPQRAKVDEVLICDIPLQHFPSFVIR